MTQDARDHWMVLLLLRALARLRDALISAVLSLVVFGCIAVVVVSLLLGASPSDGFSYVGDWIRDLSPPWLRVTARVLWVMLTGLVILAAFIGAGVYIIRWLERSGRTGMANAVRLLGVAAMAGLVGLYLWAAGYEKVRDEVVRGLFGIGVFVAYAVVLQVLWVAGRAVKRQLGFKVRGDDLAQQYAEQDKTSAGPVGKN